VCDQVAFTNLLQSNQTRIIVGVSTKAIYLCGFTLSFNAAITGTGAVGLLTGTGTNCLTNQAILWQIDVYSGTPQTIPIPVGSIAVIPPGSDVCVFTGSIGSSVSAQVDLSFAQF
jgi:hypothetical protein